MPCSTASMLCNLDFAVGLSQLTVFRNDYHTSLKDNGIWYYCESILWSIITTCCPPSLSCNVCLTHVAKVWCEYIVCSFNLAQAAQVVPPLSFCVAPLSQHLHALPYLLSKCGPIVSACSGLARHRHRLARTVAHTHT